MDHWKPGKRTPEECFAKMREHKEKAEQVRAAGHDPSFHCFMVRFYMNLANRTVRLQQRSVNP